MTTIYVLRIVFLVLFSFCISLSAARPNKLSAYPPCTAKYDSSHRYITLSNGIFESVFDVKTGDQYSWSTPMLSGDENLLRDGNASWNSDRGGGADYSPSNMALDLVVNTPDLIHLAFFEPSGAKDHPNLPFFNWSFHYVIERGLNGMYTWSVLERNQTIDPNADPYTIVEYRYTVRLSRGTKEAKYSDNPFDTVRISDSFNTSRLQPNYQQCLDGVSGTIPGEPKEVELVKLNDGKQVYLHKYDTCLRALEHRVHGWYNSSDHRGIWIVTPDYSYHNGNFMNQELTSYGPTTGTSSIFGMLQYTAGMHYDSGEEGIRLDKPGGFKKIYGPFLVYANRGSSNDDTWNDAYNQWSIEKSKWPYTFVEDKDYSRDNRAVVRGIIHVAESEIGPDAEGQAGTLVVLSLPIATNGPLRQQSNGYWYANYTDQAGRFMIQHVIAGEYEIHVFKNGTFGNYTHPKLVTATGKAQIDVGRIEWTPVRYGVTLWSIGRPDLDSREFGQGHLAQTWGMWARFSRYFPKGVNYHVNMNQTHQQQQEQWHKEWYFEQVPVSDDPSKVNAKWSDVTWNVTFDSPVSLSEFKQMSLRVGLAGVVRCGLSVYMNGQQVVDWLDLREWNDMSVYRDQSYGQYNMKEVNMSTSLLSENTNIMNLVTSCVQPMYGNGIQYDYLRLELFDERL